MKILVSAYACAPNRGSEHGSAWNWIGELARLGHQVCVLVSPAHKRAIEDASTEGPLRQIRWVFPTVNFWQLEQGKEPKRERTYNLLWQIAALRAAKMLHREVCFDVVHHLTWGGVRAPTFLGALGIPLIVGPIGGGEASPLSLRDAFPLSGKIIEAVRDVSNYTITINPFVRKGLNDAAVIFARTADTRKLLTREMQTKTLVRMELGITAQQIGAARSYGQSPRRLLYAGRLLYWKGVHIAIQALAELVIKMPDTRLTIVGNGPEERRLKSDVSRMRLESNVDFISWMPQQEFLRLYDTHDILFFPSLHDSTGWVVLEAFCHGMPVVCLNLGGPKDIVTPASGVVVDTRGSNTAQVAKDLAEKLHKVLSSETLMTELSAGAISRANDFLLSDQVSGLYAQALHLIKGGERAPLIHTTPPAMVRTTVASVGSFDAPLSHPGKYPETRH